jgi:hypothetical protein
VRLIWAKYPVQAVPDRALLFVVAQVFGRPDAGRSAGRSSL